MWLTILILVVTLIGIIYGASFLVDGSSTVARRFNISEFVVGALIVGVGTSFPELAVSLMGILNGSSDIAIGNVVGSNIFNILGILGITALVFPINVIKDNNKFDMIFCIGVSMILTLAVFVVGGGTLTMFSGIGLLLLFGLYTWVSFTQNNVSANVVNNSEESIWKSVVKIIGGLIVLILSCKYFVDASVDIAKSIGLSEAVISLTLIACGTSLPELAASVVAAFKKNTELAIGNIIGSNIFNITVILGICSLVSPLNSIGITIVDYIVMVVAAILVFVCSTNGKINRLSGGLMLLSFIAYTSFLILF